MTHDSEVCEGPHSLLQPWQLRIDFPCVLSVCEAGTLKHLSNALRSAALKFVADIGVEDQTVPFLCCHRFLCDLKRGVTIERDPDFTRDIAAGSLCARSISTALQWGLQTLL